MTKIRLGTRKSRLAMWQTEHVAAKLKKLDQTIEVEIVPIVTLGDRVTDKPLAELGGTAVFTKEIEAALLQNDCDIAVHSLKDLATVMPDGLIIGAYLPREDPRDVFVSKDGTSLQELPAGKVIGTSSLRRVSMVKHLRPDLTVVPLRGNVPTRLGAVGKEAKDAKPYSGEALDGTVMAAAGVKRLGYGKLVTDFLPPDVFLPAPGQGVIALQIRAQDDSAIAIAAQLNCARTKLAAVAERTFLNVMEGGCRLPIGAFSTFTDTTVDLSGIILSPDGRKTVKGHVEGTDPVTVGTQLAQDLLARGGKEILDAVRDSLPGSDK
ncbi:MAG: hydroxymethylbilane synthase [Deltaproteobacteria bacterium]|nr:hydroxymethylbilane synthase [Deltaproteobacteria bacterium]MBN2672371.1 hydroxymethylbilane synthase [Deltaproteobacteria bacterium]